MIRKLRTLVEIKRAAKPSSDFAFSDETESLGKVWIELTQLTGTERLNAMQMYAGATWRGVCRESTHEIDSGCWFEHGAARYEIQGIVSDGAYRIMMLTTGA